MYMERIPLLVPYSTFLTITLETLWWFFFFSLSISSNYHFPVGAGQMESVKQLQVRHHQPTHIYMSRVSSTGHGCSKLCYKRLHCRLPRIIAIWDVRLIVFTWTLLNVSGINNLDVFKTSRKIVSKLLALSIKHVKISGSC